MDSSKPALRRPCQQTVLRSFIKEQARLWALLWERQAGKSTTMAEFALYEMLRHENRTVIYGSASLLLSQEIRHPRKEAGSRSLTVAAQLGRRRHVLLGMRAGYLRPR